MALLAECMLWLYEVEVVWRLWHGKRTSVAFRAIRYRCSKVKRISCVCVQMNRPLRRRQKKVGMNSIDRGECLDKVGRLSM